MNKSFQIIFSIALVISICGICAVCSNAKHDNNSKVTDITKRFVFRNGEKLYARYCAPCHGEQGEGDGIYFGLDPNPADFTAPDFFQNRSETDLLTVVSKGSKSLGKSNLCPPWEGTLNGEEIFSIVAILKIKFEKEDTLRFHN
ncbi:MAG: cytochrome c [Candidatus Glassbacteria bacterium]|nr:cytochrome c [Candidatus Glassbacteria bacterium]